MIQILAEKRDLHKFGEFKPQFKLHKPAMRNSEKDIYAINVESTDALLLLCEKVNATLRGFEIRDVNFRIGRYSEVGSVKLEGCR